MSEPNATVIVSMKPPYIPMSPSERDVTFGRRHRCLIVYNGFPVSWFEGIVQIAKAELCDDDGILMAIGVTQALGFLYPEDLHASAAFCRKSEIASILAELDELAAAKYPNDPVMAWRASTKPGESSIYMVHALAQFTDVRAFPEKPAFPVDQDSYRRCAQALRDCFPERRAWTATDREVIATRLEVSDPRWAEHVPKIFLALDVLKVTR